MRTFEYGVDTLIHYNSDLSGEAIIVDKSTKISVTVPCEALISFVANYIRETKISEIENMSDEEILNNLMDNIKI